MRRVTRRYVILLTWPCMDKRIWRIDRKSSVGPVLYTWHQPSPVDEVTRVFAHHQVAFETLRHGALQEADSPRRGHCRSPGVHSRLGDLGGPKDPVPDERQRCFQLETFSRGNSGNGITHWDSVVGNAAARWQVAVVFVKLLQQAVAVPGTAPGVLPLASRPKPLCLLLPVVSPGWAARLSLWPFPALELLCLCPCEAFPWSAY